MGILKFLQVFVPSPISADWGVYSIVQYVERIMVTESGNDGEQFSGFGLEEFG